MAANGTAACPDLHSTGVPDTPVEVLTDILARASAEDDVASLKRLVQQAYKLTAGLDPYLTAISSPASKDCQQLVDATLKHPWSEVHQQGLTQYHLKKECCAGALEGSLISALCRLTGAKTVLEVGMFTGTTTMAIADSIPDDGKVYALELERYLQEFAAPHFERAGVSDKIEVLVGAASDSISQLAGQGVRFDLAFLDADKTGYLGYYSQLMDNNLILPGGAIVVDNTLMKGRTYEPGEVADEMADAIREFNQAVINDARVSVVTLPFRDGVSIITRKVTSSPKDDDVVKGLGRNLVLQQFKLGGRVALVTGGGQGIGRAFAHALGEAGAAVAVVDINEAGAAAVRDELWQKGIRSIAVRTDVTKAKECQRMVETVVEQLGGLDIAINNAGLNRNSAAEDTSEEEWDMTFELNTKAVFLCCQAEGRYMLQQGRGKIINTASMASLLVPHPQKQLVYNASKAAVVKLTQSLATEWAARGVAVNCISPGIVNTPLIQESETLRPLSKEWINQIPIGRLAEVTDLQTAIVFMASASNYMVGHNLVIEGGQSLW